MNSFAFEKFINKLNDFEVEIIGKSVLNKNLYAIKKEFSAGFQWALLTAGIHAREHLSTDLVCRFIEDLKAKNLPYNIAFIPQINPDGADICLDGISTLESSRQQFLLSINKSNDFSLFKANANGVDLNNNFDANWQKQFSNKTTPSSSGFYGKQPFSEPESFAMAEFTKKLAPFITINYHLKGEEIYFDFFQDKNLLRDRKIAEIFAKSTGYKIKFTQNVSSGGFKDWCVQTLGIPSLTIEVGEDSFSHPFPNDQLDNIYQKNKNIFSDLEKSLKIFKKF